MFHRTPKEKNCCGGSPHLVLLAILERHHRYLDGDVQVLGGVLHEDAGGSGRLDKAQGGLRGCAWVSNAATRQVVPPQLMRKRRCQSTKGGAE